MLNMVKGWFSDRHNVSEATGNDSETDVRRAVCALLLEIANIDDRFTEEERGRIVAVLKSKYGLSRQDANALIAASRQALKESTDLWQFAQLINEQRSTEEKIRIMETLWRVIYADGKLDQHEDYLIHKLSTLLRLDHQQMIEAKLKVLAEIR